MTSPIRIALLGGAITLAACQQQAARDPAAEPEQPAAAAPSGASPASASPVPSKGDGTAMTDAMAGENDGSPDITPPPLTPEAARTDTGARSVLLSWARGIELREFDQAWTMMGDSAKAQIGRPAFNALFHPLRNITVAVPGGTMEGAAGSSYYSVPTTVTGTRADGTRAVLKGEVVLRRANDVPGATREQLSWHIVKVDLTPV